MSDTDVHRVFGQAVRVAGAQKLGAVLDVRTVVMPPAYVAAGHPVDLSAAFREVLAVVVLRAYVTATTLSDGRLYAPAETGTDTYANRKFRFQAFTPRAALTPAGTVANHTHTYDRTDTTTSAQSFDGGVGASVAPTHTHNVAHTSTPTGGTAPAFTGTEAPAAAASEVAAGVDLSGVTVEYLVVGVPA